MDREYWKQYGYIFVLYAQDLLQLSGGALANEAAAKLCEFQQGLENNG